MKLMLIDIFNSKKQKIKIIKKNSNLGEVFYIYINKKVLSNINRCNFISKLYTLYVKKVILKKEEFIYVVSKSLKKYNIDNYLNLFDNLYKIELNKSNIRENSIFYVENENRNSHITLVTNSISKNLIIKYLERFKDLTIYTEKGLNSRVDKNMLKEIQEEYGTVIDILTNVDRHECDSLIFLDDIPINNMIKSKKTYILTDNILDKFSDEYKIYTIYAQQIVDVGRYMSRELASSMLYLHNLNKKD